MKDELTNMTQAWNKEISESETGIKPIAPENIHLSTQIFINFFFVLSKKNVYN